MLEHEHDQRDEADRLDRVADAFVERVVRRAEAEPRHETDDEGGEQRRSPGQPTIGAGRHPVDDGQHHSGEQAVDAILRISERSLEMALRDSHRPDGEHEQADEPERRENRSRAEAPSRKQEQHRRQEEIEVLFDGKAPCLRNRRAEIVLQVREVLHEKAARRMAMNDRMERDEDIVGRPDLEDAPHDEAVRVDRSALCVLPEQQAADEKTAQRKEQVHALPAEVRERILQDRYDRQAGIDGAEVIPHHGDDCDPAQEIELDRPVANDRLRPSKRIRHHRLPSSVLAATIRPFDLRSRHAHGPANIPAATDKLDLAVGPHSAATPRAGSAAGLSGAHPSISAER